MCTWWDYRHFIDLGFGARNQMRPSSGVAPVSAEVLISSVVESGREK